MQNIMYYQNKVVRKYKDLKYDELLYSLTQSKYDEFYVLIKNSKMFIYENFSELMFRNSDRPLSDLNKYIILTKSQLNKYLI